MISFDRKRIKNIVLTLSILVIMALFGYFYLWEQVLKERVWYKIVGKTDKDIITDLKINGINLPKDSENSLFFYTISEKESGEVLDFNIEIQTSSTTKVTKYIDDVEYPDDITITKTINFDDSIKVRVEDKFYYHEYKIIYTNLPVIEISNDYTTITSDYSKGRINVVSEDDANLMTNIEVRFRGNSSIYYPKKSMRIKILDYDYNRLEYPLFGMRQDSEWVLDPLYKDASRLRVAIASQTWNLLNKDQPEDSYAALNWRFCEVIVGGRYMGLYMLKEPFDAKQFSLNENSALIRGVYNYQIDFSHFAISNVKERDYYGLELKYPKDKIDVSDAWYSVLSRIQPIYEKNAVITDEAIESAFYLDNFINYKLFVELTNAVDNKVRKNVYYAVKDIYDVNQRVTVSPWDVDITYGNVWNNEIGDIALDFVTAYDRISLDTRNAPKYAQKLKERWEEVKHETVNPERLQKLMDDYYRTLTIGHALDREQNKWGNTRVENELYLMKVWIFDRYTNLDNTIQNL